MACRTHATLRTISDFKAPWKFTEKSSGRLKQTPTKGAGGIRNKRSKLV